MKRAAGDLVLEVRRASSRRLMPVYKRGHISDGKLFTSHCLWWLGVYVRFIRRDTING